MDEHLRDRDIEALLEETDSPGAQRALRHLLGGCESCAGRLAEVALAELEEATLSVDETGYDGALERAWQRASVEDSPLGGGAAPP